jgi:hypothetical protein
LKGSYFTKRFHSGYGCAHLRVVALPLGVAARMWADAPEYFLFPSFCFCGAVIPYEYEMV